MMKRISSRMTFFNKRIFPLFWFGFLGFAVVSGVVKSFKDHEVIPLPGLLIPLGMMVFGYFLMRVIVFDLMDEVLDAGDYLLVKKGGREEQIQLSDIINVSFSNLSYPQRVTLKLRRPSYWGTEIIFSPPASWAPFRKNPIVEDLIERVDATRRSS